MAANLKVKSRYLGHGLLAMLLCLSLSLFIAEVRADGDMQCSRTGTGDVQCPSGTVPYNKGNAPSLDPTKIVKGSSILGGGAIDLSALTGGSSSGIMDQLTSFFDQLIPALKNMFLSALLDKLDSGGAISNLLSQFGQVQQGLQGLSGAVCGGGSGGGTPVTGGIFNFAQNMITQMANSGGIGSIGGNIQQQVCGAISGITGGGGPTGPIDTLSVGGKKIAECAQRSIGDSTADVASTQGGALGCALAVSRMLDCAGYGVGTHVSTVALYNALESDPCYEKVDTGHITSSDAMNLQPGDVLVTKRASRAGHTGIYVGNGNIISNSSSGFQGSAKGTIQQNYTVKKWAGVTGRNPEGSAVFRRICE